MLEVEATRIPHFAEVGLNPGVLNFQKGPIQGWCLPWCKQSRLEAIAWGSEGSDRCIRSMSLSPALVKACTGTRLKVDLFGEVQG